MMYLDTHVVAWLYAGEINRFSKHAQECLENEDLGVSPIVLLELQYLKETGRLTEGASVIFQTLAQSIGLFVCTEPFMKVITESLTLHWTRDPFDRLIVAHAQIKNHPLITKDRTIHRHFSSAIW